MRVPFNSPTSKCLAQLAMLHAAHAFAAPLSSSSRWALRSSRSAGTIGTWRGGSSMSTAPPTSYDSSAYEVTTAPRLGHFDRQTSVISAASANSGACAASATPTTTAAVIATTLP